MIKLNIKVGILYSTITQAFLPFKIVKDENLNTYIDPHDNAECSQIWLKGFWYIFWYVMFPWWFCLHCDWKCSLAFYELTKPQLKGNLWNKTTVTAGWGKFKQTHHPFFMFSYNNLLQQYGFIENTKIIYFCHLQVPDVKVESNDLSTAMGQKYNWCIRKR